MRVSVYLRRIGLANGREFENPIATASSASFVALFPAAHHAIAVEDRPRCAQPPTANRRVRSIPRTWLDFRRNPCLETTNDDRQGKRAVSFAKFRSTNWRHSPVSALGHLTRQLTPENEKCWEADNVVNVGNRSSRLQRNSFSLYCLRRNIQKCRTDFLIVKRRQISPRKLLFRSGQDRGLTRVFRRRSMTQVGGRKRPFLGRGFGHDPRRVRDSAVRGSHNPVQGPDQPRSVNPPTPRRKKKVQRRMPR